MLRSFINRLFGQDQNSADPHHTIKTGAQHFTPAPLRAPLMFVLLADPSPLHAALKEDELRDTLADPELTLTRPGDGNGNTLVIRWYGNVYTAFLVPHPVPAPEFAAALGSPGAGAQEREIAESHRAHLVVTPLQTPSYMGAAMTLSVHLMVLVNALATALGNATGYFWTHSQQVLTPDAYTTKATAALDALTRQSKGDTSATEALPLSFWVGIRLFSDRTKHAGLTQGLVAYTGYELEIAFIDRSERDVFRYLAACISYLFANGHVLGVGQTIQLEPDAKFRINFLPPDTSRPPTLILRQENTQSNTEIE